MVVRAEVVDNELRLGVSPRAEAPAGLPRVLLADSRQLALKDADHGVGVACDFDEVEVDAEVVLQIGAFSRDGDKTRVPRTIIRAAKKGGRDIKSVKCLFVFAEKMTPTYTRNREYCCTP